MKFVSAILALPLLSGLVSARSAENAGKAQGNNRVVSASELLS